MYASSRKPTVCIAFLGAVMILTEARPADAGYLASDLGAGNNYSQSIGYTLSGPQVASRIGYTLAIQFSINAPTPVAFGSASLALEFHSGANSLAVELLTDAIGLPGSILETINLSGVPVGPSLVTVNSSVHTMLNPGTKYWLAAVASGDTSMSWMANSTGSTDHLAVRVDSGSGPGLWGTASAPDVAFAITAIPTPPSLSLLAIGLVGLAGFGKLRRMAR